MSKSKRFYWIKLKENFFDLETIDWLMSQKNGCEYIVLYQKLCLLTANKDGNLSTTIGEMIIPYDFNKIARDTKFNIDTVIVAMELFRKVGLIYEQDNGILKIPYVQELVGSETEYAEKKRKYRQGLIGKEDNVPKLSQNQVDNVRQEKDIENRDKENRDIEVDVENTEIDYTDYNNLSKFKQHLFLSDKQVEELLDKLGLEMFDEYTYRLNEYIEKTGYTIKNHYETILKWYNEDRKV